MERLGLAAPVALCFKHRLGKHKVRQAQTPSILLPSRRCPSCCERWRPHLRRPTASGARWLPHSTLWLPGTGPAADAAGSSGRARGRRPLDRPVGGRAPAPVPASPGRPGFRPRCGPTSPNWSVISTSAARSPSRRHTTSARSRIRAPRQPVPMPLDERPEGDNQPHPRRPGGGLTQRLSGSPVQVGELAASAQADSGRSSRTNPSQARAFSAIL